MIDENWDRDYLKMWLGKCLQMPGYTKIIVTGIDYGTSLVGEGVVICFCLVYKTTSRFEGPDNKQYTVPYDYVKSHMTEYMREQKLNDLLDE